MNGGWNLKRNKAFWLAGLTGFLFLWPMATRRWPSETKGHPSKWRNRKRRATDAPLKRLSLIHHFGQPSCRHTIKLGGVVPPPPLARITKQNQKQMRPKRGSKLLGDAHFECRTIPFQHLPRKNAKKKKENWRTADREMDQPTFRLDVPGEPNEGTFTEYVR